MQKTLPVFILICTLLFTACSPQVTAAPTLEPSTPAATQAPSAVPPTEAVPSSGPKSYANDAFGLSFQFPADWFGAEEYISEQTLRVEVGSDTVYPYGETPEQPSTVTNSYDVVIQYTKNNQNPFWEDTYQSLQNLKDGESLSDTRSLIIRVRQIDLGRFKGFEYIFTLPETAQTEHVYGREVMLVDEQTHDLLTIMGQPINVEVGSGANWRDVYRTIDEANLTFFHEIVDSITVAP
jgi:hypothetical protein